MTPKENRRHVCLFELLVHWYIGLVRQCSASVASAASNCAANAKIRTAVYKLLNMTHFMKADSTSLK
jgi:hypothetical protein